MQTTIQLISGLAVGSIYALVAIGFSMIYRAMGLVNFAQGDIMMVGAFLGYTILAMNPALPYLAAVIGAPILTALLGYLIQWLILRRPIHNKADQTYLVLLTLGVGMVLSNVARLVWGADPVVYPSPITHEVIRVFGYPLPGVYPYIFGAMIVLLGGLQWFFAKTWIGMAIRAASSDADTAMLMGIDPDRAASVAFAVAAATGALGGVLYAPITFASFDMGVVGVKAFAAAAVGSLGSVPGALVGGLVIGVGETFGAELISNAYTDSIAFMVMILVLIVRPYGLFPQGHRP